MGTLQGHLLPGSLFIAAALWWTVQITKRAWICHRKSLVFYSSSTYSGLWGRCLIWPVEGLLKLAVTSVGIILELLASTDFGRAGKVIYYGDLQHVTMYLFFFLNGAIDVMTYRRCACVPKGADDISLSLAFAVELLLFNYHLHGRSDVDVRLHVLMLYAVAGCVITTLLAFRWRHSLLAAYARAYSLLLQGTWFVHVGVMLYPPWPSLSSEDADKEELLMLSTMMFAWHAAADAVVMFVVCCVARAFYDRVCFIRAGCREYDMVGMETMTSPQATLVNGGGYKTLESGATSDDEDEHILFDQSA